MWRARNQRDRYVRNQCPSVLPIHACCGSVDARLFIYCITVVHLLMKLLECPFSAQTSIGQQPNGMNLKDVSIRKKRSAIQIGTKGRPALGGDSLDPGQPGHGRSWRRLPLRGQTVGAVAWEKDDWRRCGALPVRGPRGQCVGRYDHRTRTVRRRGFPLLRAC